MNMRGFRARWHMEVCSSFNKKWEWKVISSVYFTGTWEEAVEYCSQLVRNKNGRWRVSPVAVLLDEK